MAALQSQSTATTTIQASVLHGIRDLRTETRTITPPGPDELQIAIRATGLCGSDLHYYNHYAIGDIQVQQPLSLGHESAGEVVAVGENVNKDLKEDKFRVGDKVALEVGQPCGECELCGMGRYNICKTMRFRSSAKSYPHAQGTLQERINHPAAWCHKLPSHVPLHLGALLEPLSVAIHATRRAALPQSVNVLVFGAGAVGLLVAAMAKIAGAATVVIADIDAGRVEFAVQNKFAHRGFVVPMRRGATIEENLAIAKETALEAGKVERVIGGGAIGEFDAIYECTGVPSCVQAGIFAARPGGRLLLIGMGTPIQTLPISAAALREVDIIGVFRYANTYPKGIEVVTKSLEATDDSYPDFSKLVTHAFSGLEQIEDAFRMASQTKDAEGKLVLKVMVDA